MICAFNTRNGARSLHLEALTHSLVLGTFITTVMLLVFFLFGRLLRLTVLLSQKMCYRNWTTVTNNYCVLSSDSFCLEVIMLYLYSYDFVFCL